MYRIFIGDEQIVMIILSYCVIWQLINFQTYAGSNRITAAMWLLIRSMCHSNFVDQAARSCLLTLCVRRT